MATAGTFAAPTILNISGGDAIRSAGIAAADFDGDSNVDIALLNSNDISGIYYGKGDGTFTSVPANGLSYPKDLINLYVGGPSLAVDLNKDSRPDILVNNVILLNLYASAPTVVSQFNTSTKLATSATSIASGSLVTFTATVTPAAGSTGTPSGSVDFADGETLIGTATVSTSGTATFSTTALAVGSRTITAAYGGSATFLGSLSSSVSVNVAGAAPGIATTTAISSSATTAVLGGGLYDGSGSLASGQATFTTGALGLGSHPITATYGGAATFSSSTSASVTITIAATTDFTIGLSSSTTTVAHGSSASPLTITITPIGGFKQATTLTCSGAPTNSACVLSTSTLTPADGVTAVTATLTFQAYVTNAAQSHRPRNFEFAATLPLGLLALFGLGRRRRWPMQFIALAAAAVLLAATGCGHSAPASTTTPANPGTYPLTVTATSGTLSHSVTDTVTIQ